MLVRRPLRPTGARRGPWGFRVLDGAAAAALLASCLALSACNSRPDVLYMTAGPPHVTLDERRGAWHMLVDGKDVTGVCGLTVTPAGHGTHVSLSVRVTHGTAGLPQTFQLEHHVDGTLYCPQCAAAQRVWRRVEYGKPVQG